MDNVFLTSLTTPEIRQLFRQELEKFFQDSEPVQPVIEDQQLTISELAEYLKCTKATIHAYKKRRIFPFYQTGRTVYFKKTEVEKALSVQSKLKS